MRMKKLIYVLVGVVGLLVLIVVGVAFFPAAPYEPPPRDRADETAFGLDEKVGWYQLEDSTYRLLTWGAERGLVLYGFGPTRDDLRRTVFHPASATMLTAPNTPQDRRLIFAATADSVGAVVEMTTPERTQSLVRMPGPYETREVSFSSEGVTLSGLLFMPDGPGPHPAVAFIHGSGASNRDGFWYLTPADHLARQGIAVLLPDKRGTGKSDGAWHTASFDDFAADALAAVRVLAEQPTVARDRIGLVGFSQGGWIAPLAANRSPEVAFVVAVSGSMATPDEQVAYEVRQEIADAGAPGFVATAMAPLFARRAKLPRKPWWAQNGTFDPMPYWRDLPCPALLIFGQQDQNVNVARSLARLDEAGLAERPNLTTQVYPELGHALIRPDTGWLEPDYLALLTRFILDP